MLSSIQEFPRSELITQLKNSKTDIPEYIAQIRSFNMNWVYQTFIHLYNIIAQSKESPFIKVSALKSMKNYILTCQIPCILLTQVYLVPVLYEIARHRPNQKKEKRGYRYFIDQGYSSRLQKIEEAGIQYVRLSTQILYIMSQIKQKRTINNEQLQQQSSSLQLFKQLQQLGSKNLPQDIYDLKYFSKEDVKKGQDRYKRKLYKFEEKSNQYARYFIKKMVESLSTEKNYLFSIKGKTYSSLSNDLDFKKLLKSGDTYLTSPLIQEIVDGMRISQNFIIKRNFLSLFSDFVKWADIEAIVTILYDDEIDLIAARIAQVNGEKGLDQGQKIYEEVRGQRQAKKKFYIQFMKCLQLWVNLLLTQNFSHLDTLKIQQFYTYFKVERKFIFPHNVMIDKIKQHFLENTQVNKERNERILAKIKLDSNSSINQKSSQKKGLNEIRSSLLKSSTISAKKNFASIKMQVDNCLKILVNLCDDEEALQQKINTLKKFKEDFDVDLDNLEDTPQESQFLEVLDDGDALISSINQIERYYEDYNKKKISYQQFCELWDKKLISIEKSVNSATIQENQQKSYKLKSNKISEISQENENSSVSDRLQNGQQESHNKTDLPKQLIFVKKQNVHPYQIQYRSNEKNREQEKPNKQNTTNFRTPQFTHTKKQPSSLNPNQQRSQSFGNNIDQKQQSTRRQIINDKPLEVDLNHQNLEQFNDSVNYTEDDHHIHYQNEQDNTVSKSLQSEENQFLQNHKPEKQISLSMDSYYSINNTFGHDPQNSSGTDLTFYHSFRNKQEETINRPIYNDYHGQLQAKKLESPIIPQFHSAVNQPNNQRRYAPSFAALNKQEELADKVQKFDGNVNQFDIKKKGQIYRQQMQANSIQQSQDKVDKIQIQPLQLQLQPSSELQQKSQLSLPNQQSQIINLNIKSDRLSSIRSNRSNRSNRSSRSRQSNSIKIKSSYCRESRHSKKSDLIQKNIKANMQYRLHNDTISLQNNSMLSKSSEKSKKTLENRSVHQVDLCNPKTKQSQLEIMNEYGTKFAKPMVMKKQSKIIPQKSEYIEYNREKDRPKNEKKRQTLTTMNIQSSQKLEIRKQGQQHKQPPSQYLEKSKKKVNKLNNLSRKKTQQELASRIKQEPIEQYLSLKYNAKFGKDSEIQNMRSRIERLRRESSSIKRQLSFRSSINRSRQASIDSVGSNRSYSNNSQSQFSIGYKTLSGASVKKIEKCTQITDQKFQEHFSEYGGNQFKKCLIKQKALIEKTDLMEFGCFIVYEKTKTIKFSLYITPTQNITGLKHKISQSADLLIKSYPERFEKVAKDHQVKITIIISAQTFPFKLPNITITYLDTNKQLIKENFYLPISPYRFCHFETISPSDALPIQYEKKHWMTTKLFKINRKVVKIDRLKEYFNGLAVLKEQQNVTQYRNKLVLNDFPFEIYFITKGSTYLEIKASISQDDLLENRIILQNIEFILSSLKSILKAKSPK